MENRLFKKHDLIKSEGKFFIAICCDDEYAVFGAAAYSRKDGCLTTDFENLFVVSNVPALSNGIFKFERVTGGDIMNDDFKEEV